MSVKLRTKVLMDGRRSLYLDCYSNGRRRAIFLELYLGKDADANKNTMAMANKFRMQKELEQASGRLGVQLESKHVRIYDLFQKVAQGKRGVNKKLYLLGLKHVQEFGGNDLTIQHINPLFAEDFKIYLLGRMRASTAGCMFHKLKYVMKYAIKLQLVDRNPCDDIKIKAQEPSPRYLTLEEVKRLSSTPCINQQIKNAFLFGGTITPIKVIRPIVKYKR